MTTQAGQKRPIGPSTTRRASSPCIFNLGDDDVATATRRRPWDVSLDKFLGGLDTHSNSAACPASRAQSYDDSHCSSRPDPALYEFTNDN